MSSHQHSIGPQESYDSPDLVLATLHDRHQIATRVEIDKLQLAVQWAVMHPVESIDQGAATLEGTEGELAIAGEGAPLVAEFCVADLALALGISTDAGRSYLGDAVEIRYRLPRLWEQVTSGRVPVWKARKIAAATKSLCPEAAAHVDTHLAPVAGRCSFAQLDRTIADALARHDPVEAEHRRLLAAEERHFDVDVHQVSFNGTVHVEGDLDLADALDLDDAITAGAAHLADLGCDESLDVRRSMAAGALARGELTLDLEPGTSQQTHQPERRGRDLTIYLHLSDTAVAGVAGVAGVENTRSSISVEQVKEWCAGSNTKVTIRPVIDLNENLTTAGYRPTPVMREQAVLTNAVCVFPHCTRPARSADLDHLEAWRDEHDRDGPRTDGVTESINIAPACRSHHRYKTHAGWDVVRTGPTSFTWTSPYGYAYEWDTSHARHTC